MNFGILGPGHIAAKMAETITQMDGINCYAVASRNMDRAKEFASTWGFSKAYGSYEAMLMDSEVELVYIATPHSHHYECAKLCLEHGKHVLVEKAFTLSEVQAAELVRIAREKKLLLAEAIWTRYMPSRSMLETLLADGAIGEVTSVTANLGYLVAGKERLQQPELGGGALLDLGVYTINFALMVMKDKIKKITSDAIMSDTGVDLSNTITITFEGNKMASLHSTTLARTNRLGVVSGTKGYLEVQNINNCEEIRVYDVEDHLLATHKVPKQITGFEYQVEACIRAISKGSIECEEMPHDEILRVMRIMDEVRGPWGMKFPNETI